MTPINIGRMDVDSYPERVQNCVKKKKTCDPVRLWIHDHSAGLGSIIIIIMYCGLSSRVRLFFLMHKIVFRGRLYKTAAAFHRRVSRIRTCTNNIAVLYIIRNTDDGPTRAIRRRRVHMCIPTLILI